MFMPEAHNFSVPTGQFKVDRALLKELLHCTSILRQSDIPHFVDHSIEMLLIFAARYFPQTLILPIIVSGVDDQALDSLFSNLQFILGDRIASTLFVLTTNLAVDEDADHCLALSAAFVESIEKREVDRILSSCDGAPSFCGAHHRGVFAPSLFFWPEADDFWTWKLGRLCRKGRAYRGIRGHGLFGMNRMDMLCRTMNGANCAK